MTSPAGVDLTLDDIRKARRAIEHCYQSGWTDGLPVVPPIPEFVDEFLAQTRRDPDEVICVARHLNRTCTVRDAAACAVMAGCLPEYFPVVIAVVECLNDINAVMSQSTTGRAYAIMINGPIRQRLGLNCAGNIFGPGHRPNATIGRALRLVIMNVFDIRPHDLDQSTHGTPGKYTLCIGEDEEESPWEPLSVEFGAPAGASTVMVQQTRGSLHVDQRTSQVPEQLLNTLAGSMSYSGHLTGSSSGPGTLQNTDGVFHKNLGCVVVIGPEHARHFGVGGWSKHEVRQFLFEHWGGTVAEWRACDTRPELEGLPDDTFVRAAARPESIKIIVAGANNAGESTLLHGYGNHAGPKLIEEP